MKSTTFSIGWMDFAKGLLMAALAPALIIIYNTVNTGSFDIDWKSVMAVAISSGLAYIIKNFFTNDVNASLKTISKAGGTVLDENGNVIAAPKPKYK